MNIIQDFLSFLPFASFAFAVYLIIYNFKESRRKYACVTNGTLISSKELYAVVTEKYITHDENIVQYYVRLKYSLDGYTFNKYDELAIKTSNSSIYKKVEKDDTFIFYEKTYTHNNKEYTIYTCPELPNIEKITYKITKLGEFMKNIISSIIIFSLIGSFIYVLLIK